MVKQTSDFSTWKVEAGESEAQCYLQLCNRLEIAKSTEEPVSKKLGRPRQAVWSTEQTPGQTRLYRETLC